MTEKETPLRLTALEIQNILRIKAVRLTMGKDALIIEGGNEQGKSSVLEALEMVLAGMSRTPDEPIHDDRKKGKIIATFGDLVVTKTFTRGKRPSLTITSGSEKQKSPQTLLESFLDFVALRPLQFLDYDAEKQLKVLSELMGMDTTALDEEEKKTYDERKDANRDVKRLKAAYESLPEHPDAPKEEMSISTFMGEIDEIQAYNRTGELLRLEDKRIQGLLQHAVAEASELKLKLDLANRRITDLTGEEKDVSENLRGFEPKDIEPVRKKIAAADETNSAVRDNVRKAEAHAAYMTAEIEATGFSDLLEDIQRQKEEARMKAAERLPVPDLALTEDGVTYKGKPLAQAGASAQLRVSVGVAMALNQDKRIKLLLLDNAEQLDPANTKLVLELAAEKGFQVIVARVGDGKEASVIIEDGAVKEEEDG